jgi:hypothetical protein
MTRRHFYAAGSRKPPCLTPRVSEGRYEIGATVDLGLTLSICAATGDDSTTATGPAEDRDAAMMASGPGTCTEH